MSGTTALDRAHSEMETGATGRLRFFAVLAETELFLLLEREAEGDAIEPRLFPVEGGDVALAFDTEARLAEFAGGVAYAALPGRVLVELLATQGLGLGLNLDVAPSSTLLPAEALDWLTRTLGVDAPSERDERISELRPPDELPHPLTDALAERLVGAAGRADRAFLAGVQYAGGGSGHLLAILGARPRDEPALARAVSEALTFSGVEEGALDVVFLAADHPLATRLGAVAMRFDIPSPAPPRREPPAAPGSDPSRPPKLR